MDENKGIPMDTGCPLSHETEDTFKEKFENLKIFVQQQQKELQSLKIRNEGVTTITTCLQEEREENNQLRNKIQKLEQSVVTLQSRLSNGHNSNTMDGETVLPGPSKQLMENLVRENTRLRQSLRQASGDPAHMEHLEKTIKSQQEQIDFLRKENNRQNEELHKLKCEAASPPDDKDVELVRLRKKMTLLQKNKEKQDVLCQSLSEESVNLRQKLKETADMCQHLARKLEEKDKSNFSPQKQVTPEESLQRISLSSQASDSGLSEECAALRLFKSRAEAEITKLKTQLKEAESANTKWQVYDAQRNQQFQLLQKQLSDSEGRLAATSGTSSLSEQQQQDIDRLLMQSKHKVDEAEQEKIKIEDENRALRVSNKQKEDAIKTLHDQIQALTTISSSVGGGQQYQEDKDHIRMLEAQVQIFTEDFEQERKDRERAQSKCAELEQELEIVKRQLDQFQVNHMSRLYNQRAASLANYQNEYFNHRNIYSMVPQGGNLIGRGLGVFEADGDGEDDNAEGEDCLDSVGDLPPVAAAVRDSVRGGSSSTAAHGAITVDGGLSPCGIVPPPLFGKNTTSTHSDCSLFRGNSTGSMNNNTSLPSDTFASTRSYTRNPSGNSKQGPSEDLFSDSGKMDTVDDTLQCPRCKKEYPRQNHGDFLDHVDKCCD